MTTKYRGYFAVGEALVEALLKVEATKKDLED
jgi:hypothetical protein